MTWRGGDAWDLVVLLAGVVVPYADPVDVIWVPGAYDGWDYAAAALTVTSPEALVDPPVPPGAPPSTSASHRGAPAACGISSDYRRTALEIRAPPLA